MQLLRPFNENFCFTILQILTSPKLPVNVAKTVAGRKVKRQDVYRCLPKPKYCEAQAHQ